MTIDHTWPQAGEMRRLWRGTTEFWTNDKPQDDTWKPYRPHSNILPLFRNHLTRNAVAMFPQPPNPVASTEHGCRDSHLPTVPHTEDPEEKGRRVGFGSARTIQRVQLPQRRPLLCHNISRRCCRSSKPKQSTTESQRRDVDTSWSSPGQVARERVRRVSCAGPSSTTRARSPEPASRSRGNW